MEAYTESGGVNVEANSMVMPLNLSAIVLNFEAFD